MHGIPTQTIVLVATAPSENQSGIIHNPKPVQLPPIDQSIVQ
jgi:hypothetical protein